MRPCLNVFVFVLGDREHEITLNVFVFVLGSREHETQFEYVCICFR